MSFDHLAEHHPQVTRRDQLDKTVVVGILFGYALITAVVVAGFCCESHWSGAGAC